MKHISQCLFLLIGLVFAVGVVSDDNWKPEVKFNFEDGSYKETLIWISGFGYAIDALGRICESCSQSRSYCSPRDEYIGSQVLLDTLNKRFEGQRITSEQATKVLIEEVLRRYPCK